MSETFKVLIIEDEPLIIDAYARALKKIELLNNSLTFEIDHASNCDKAMLKLKSAEAYDGFDIVFLDIRVPKSKESNIVCGEDIGVKIRSLFNKTKIIVSTSYSDPFRIFGILNSINPEAFLVKSDLTEAVLINAVQTVSSGHPYYSHSVNKIFRKQSANNFVIDHIDKKMLYELSNGTKMNELPQVLPLSIAALERRKRILKDIFNVNDKGDRGLLISARQRGFI